MIFLMIDSISLKFYIIFLHPTSISHTKIIVVMILVSDGLISVVGKLKRLSY